jgi:hypothetical protein
MTTTSRRRTAGTTTRGAGQRAFGLLVRLTGLGVLLQAVWAGLFLRGDTRDKHWVAVHGTGADVTTVLAGLTALLAVAVLRHRRAVVVGSVLLAVATFTEAFLGGRITEQGQDGLTAVHVPLGMLVMGLAVWLSVQAAQLRRNT